jgi:hypothetical protein
VIVPIVCSDDCPAWDELPLFGRVAVAVVVGLSVLALVVFLVMEWRDR